VVRDVERRAARRPSLKRRFAHVTFAATAVTTLRRYDRATPITIDGTWDTGEQDRAGVGPFAVVSRSTPYTYLGRRGLVIAPGAGFEHGLSLTLFRTLTVPFLLRATASALGDGHRLADHRLVVQGRDLVRLDITCDRPFPWQADGDYLGELEALTVTYRPDAITLVLPTTS
jgi:diacylglycerol kinase family enzyme